MCLRLPPSMRLCNDFESHSPDWDIIEEMRDTVLLRHGIAETLFSQGPRDSSFRQEVFLNAQYFCSYRRDFGG